MTRCERLTWLLGMALASVQVVGCLAHEIPLRFESPPEPVYGPTRTFVVTLNSGAQAVVTIAEMLGESPK